MADTTALSYLKKILAAPVYDVAKTTDFQHMKLFSAEIGNQVWLKREDQQPVKSFKLRGAYNCIANLSGEQAQRGVIAASAGNHAQGVAYSAAKKQIKATIVMPDTTPEIKVEAVRSFGKEYVDIVLHGDSFHAANNKAFELAEEHGYTMIPPFDNEHVIAGQGTIGKEILEQNPNLDVLFIAVGGGGLIAGIAAYVKTILPNVTIVAVEAEDSACLHAARQAGAPVTLPTVGIFADGVAVKRIGDETFKVTQQFVDDYITVNSDQICSAIKDTFDDTRVIAEPAGALSVAAMRKYAQQKGVKGQRFGGILCGANINFHTLRYVSERCELGEQKEAVFAVTIPEHKGAFQAFCKVIGNRSITEFNYRFSSHGQSAHVFVGTKLRGGLSEYQALTQSLDDNQYTWFDLSDNELAKLHVRYMVGGRPPALLNEHLFSFSFPESPGALLKFLNAIGEHWNITLFHYRNHGAAQGMVLAGFDIDQAEIKSFHTFLGMLGYEFEEHTDNPAYRFFLSDGG